MFIAFLAEPCGFLAIFLRQYSVLCLKQSSSAISHWPKVVKDVEAEKEQFFSTFITRENSCVKYLHHVHNLQCFVWVW